jgi:hypothetical protein
MICANDASPCINSASPGATGSTDAIVIMGEDAARSTTTIFACCAISRASVKAVSVMSSPEAVPSTVTLRAAVPAPTRTSASCSISPISATGFVRGASARGSFNNGSGVASSTLGITGSSGAIAGARTGAGGAAKAISGAISRITSGGAAPGRRGAVIRNSSPVAIAPDVSSKVASVAISTIGSFFG